MKNRSILFSLLLLGISATGVGCSSSESTTNLNTTTPMNQTITTGSGLQYIDTVVGSGTEAVAGKTVSVHYTGTLDNGTKFDSSVDRGTPFSFKLGSGMVIKGWEEGIAGMKVGGKRTLIIPATLGYGPNDYGPIPGNSTLHFDVELLDVK